MLELTSIQLLLLKRVRSEENLAKAVYKHFFYL